VPSPIDNVAGLTDITSAWGNSVADTVNELIGDLYAGSALAVPWASITGKPATFPPSIHAHIDAATGGLIDWAAITGKPATYAPSAHKASHSTGGADALTAANVGAWAKGSSGITQYAQPTEPGSAVEGDVWIKG
jgi:hypothetical protein